MDPSLDKGTPGPTHVSMPPPRPAWPLLLWGGTLAHAMFYEVPQEIPIRVGVSPVPSVPVFPST